MKKTPILGAAYIAEYRILSRQSLRQFLLYKSCAIIILLMTPCSLVFYSSPLGASCHPFCSTAFDIKQSTVALSSAADNFLNGIVANHAIAQRYITHQTRPNERLLINEPPLITESNWQQRYKIVLTQQGDHRVIFDAQGHRHTFRLSSSMDYVGTSINAGELIKHDTQYIWTNSQGVRHTFYGSHLIRITFANLNTWVFNYDRGRLASATNGNGDTLKAGYDISTSGEMILSEENVDLSASECVANVIETAKICDKDANPLPGFTNTFTNTTNDDWVNRLDVRPASCQSYFTDYFGTTRGARIENGFHQQMPYRDMIHTVRSFPIIDFINGNELIVLRSRDLGSPSFNDSSNPNALLYRLIRDGQEVKRKFLDPLALNGYVNASELGQNTQLSAEYNYPLKLHLVIRYNMAGPQHWQQIKQAKILLQERFGIQLEVVIIP